MRILLMMPKNPVFVGSTTLPLGLAYLASSLEKDGHEVECLDLRINTISVSNVLDRFDMVGISSCTPSIKEAWKLAKTAKNKGKTVILGGPHVSALPEESLNKNVDVVVRGEGEETIREVCNGTSLQKILGISYKKGNKIIHNPDRPFIQNLDKIPFPARHLFDVRRYVPEFHRHKFVGDMMTSRGCPFNCTFCYKAVFGRKYRVRTPKNVVDEWRIMINDFGYEEIGIIDDNFSANQQRAIDICNLLVKEKLNIDWCATGGLRVDCISRKLFSAMKKSGCYRIGLGVESGSQFILDRIGKGTRKEQIRKAVKVAKDYGFETYLFFMIGNLYETEKTIQQTIDFAKELDGTYTQFTIATPYPGTQMYETIKREGKLLVRDWSHYASYERKAYFEHQGVDSQFVDRMYKKAYRSYYLRPKIAFRLLKKHGLGVLKGFRLIK